jgi:hypothetical protein
MHHACTGRALIRIGDKADLNSDHKLWEDVWSEARAELIAYWLDQHPMSRPEAWWLFDAGDLPEQGEDETDPEYLGRLDLVTQAEVNTVVEKARHLARNNAPWTRGDVRGHFIEPDDTILYVASLGFLTATERDHLGLEPQKGPHPNGTAEHSEHRSKGLRRQQPPGQVPPPPSE